MGDPAGHSLHNAPGGRQKLTPFAFTMMTGAALLTVRNLPVQAEVGLQVVAMIAFAAFFWFIPTALISAELGAAWPHEGGVYEWVRQAFGERWGFVAIWLQWMNANFLMIAVHIFIAGSLAFIVGVPDLDASKPFIFAVILAVYWGATFANFKGIKRSGLISSVGFVAGVIVPAVVIVVLGLVYVLAGKPSRLDTHFAVANMVPDLSNVQGLVLVSAFILTFIGVEVSAGNLRRLENVQRVYPRIIVLTIVMALAVNLFGSLAVAVVVPRKDLTLDAGVVQAFRAFFDTFLGRTATSVAVWVFAAALAAGAVAEVTAYLVNPVKGLLMGADNGDIPPYFCKRNRHDVPARLMVAQATVVSVLALGFLVIPGVDLAMWMFSALVVLVHLAQYVLMYLAVARLRRTQPDKERPYRIPFGTFGMWLAVVVATTVSVGVFLLSFLPPRQLEGRQGDALLFLVVTTVLFLFSAVSPFVVYARRKPEWRSALEAPAETSAETPAGAVSAGGGSA